MAEHEPCIGETSEWFTSPEIFAALRLKFDLDPCSPGRGLCHVPAKRIYTKEDDGLVQPWFGLVFCNPPFGGRNGHVPWLRKFFAHGNGIAIVRAYTSTPWWHPIPAGENEVHQTGRLDRQVPRPRNRSRRHGRGRMPGVAGFRAGHGLGSARARAERIVNTEFRPRPARRHRRRVLHAVRGRTLTPASSIPEAKVWRTTCLTNRIFSPQPSKGGVMS